MVLIFWILLIFSFIDLRFCDNCGDGDTVGNVDFKKGIDKHDDLDQTLYLAASSLFTYTCCGLARQIKTYVTKDVEFHALVWRPQIEPGKYKLVNDFSFNITGAPTARAASVSPIARPRVKVGDIVGWYSHGISRVPYVNKKMDGYVRMLPVTSYPEVGDVIDWSDSKKETNRLYAVFEVLQGNIEPPEFKKLVESMDVDVTTEVGSDIYTLIIANERLVDLVITITPDAYFKIDTEGRLLVARPLVLGSTTVHITAVNICGVSSKASIVIQVAEGVTPAPPTTTTQLPPPPPLTTATTTIATTTTTLTTKPPPRTNLTLPPTTKPPPPTTKPRPLTTKPAPLTTKPPPPTTKPQPITAKPPPSTTKPQPITTKPQPITTKPQPITTKPQPITTKPLPITTTVIVTRSTESPSNTYTTNNFPDADVGDTSIINDTITRNVTDAEEQGHSDGWKIGVGITVTLVLIAVIVPVVWFVLKKEQWKYRGKTCPDQKTDEERTQQNGKDTLKVPEIE